VITVGAPADDVEEFRLFGADVTSVPAAMPWAADDRAFDFAYVYLPAAAGDMARLAAEIRRVLEPAGRAVVVFRNRNSLRVWSRMRSYFGDACDLLDLAGPRQLIAAVELDRAQATEYVDPAEVERTFAAFSEARMRISNLLPEDLAAGEVPSYAPGFWAWMSETFGRFVVVSVTP
jgi:SAM-dependent methyltransferase